MDERKLKYMLDHRAAGPDENDRKAALNLALAEFDAVQAERNNISQGNGLWARLTGRSNPQERRQTMNKKFLYGGMATAMVVVMAAGVSMQMLPQHGGEMAAVSGLVEAPGSEEVSMAYQGAVVEYNVNQVERGLKQADSASPAKRETRQRVESEADMMVAGAPPMAAQTRGGPAEAKRMAPGVAYMAESSMIMPYPEPMPHYQEQGRDKFEEVKDNPVKTVSAEPVSTFSIDVDTASYSVVRKQINNGVLPPADAVRIEEMVNYFDYDYALPADKAQPFQPNVTVVPSPWAEGRKLVHIGIKGFDIPATEKPRSNLVFLIDVSGSMNAQDKLPLLKSSMKMLLDTMGPEDTVGIVTYAGHAGTVLEPTKVSDKAKIITAIENLNPGGGTAGAAGIEEAYRLAEQHKGAADDSGSVSRVILATDGDFNVGASSTDDLKKLIEQKRKSGVFLSVLGFGLGNLNDHMMQTLAQNGNGTAAYIDNLNEARKVLVEESSSTLFTIAKDVKIQVEFNPATVAEYRLIGYETRALNREDFNNDAVDAGDIGAGHTVTAIYEITPVGGPVMVDPSRYAAAPAAPAETAKADTEFGSEYAFLKMRYKLPNEDVSKLITTPITTADEKEPSQDVQWAVAVAGFGQILKGGDYMNGFTYEDVIKRAVNAKGTDEFGYRAEFINIVRLAKTLAGE
ncbi:MAG: VWA domain-containing protein [Alphaproteobacteria bacterium]|nr:VWA domain-containing protein [Alphaproteobacteria bacterium]